MPDGDDDAGMYLAVIGMAGRFPKVSSIEEYWAALRAGRDLLTRFPAHLETGHVPAFGVVDGAEDFDASFFGIPEHEARIMDPQHRVFMECAWEAIEHAGYDPTRFPGPIGVYGGMTETDYVGRLYSMPHIAPVDVRRATDMAYLTGRTAYKLGLTGPAISVQTGCATALVAVHLAGQALTSGECDIALAGGVSMMVPHPTEVDGPEGVISSDGYVRSFDVAGDGIVLSNGAGMLALRRLDDALADGDRIHAVIRGSAMSNDGARKVGLDAFSIEGLASAIRAAYQVAGVDPASVDYVEVASGAASPLDRSIELVALSKVFTRRPVGSPACRLGSVKANVGNTDCANGVVGLIAVILAMAHETLPGTAHLRTPDPEMDLAAGFFEVSAEPISWPRSDKPRRAGVTSFAHGGTNVHLVVEEPPAPPTPEPARPYHLLPLSARSASALEQSARRLAEALGATSAPIADIAFTLQTGRQAFSHRGFVIASGAREAARALAGPGLVTSDAPAGNPVVAFLLADVNLAQARTTRTLYDHEPAFRTAIDRCADLVDAESRIDVRRVLYPADDVVPDGGAGAPPATAVVRAVSFMVQYALACLWQEWGVHPVRVAGVGGAGEQVAAVVSGLLPMPDAVRTLLGRHPQPATPQPSPPGGRRLPAWMSTRTGGHVSADGLAAPGLRALPGGDVQAAAALLADRPGTTLALGPPAAFPTGPLPVLTCLPESTDGSPGPDAAPAMLAAAGRLWLAGVRVDWSTLHEPYRRRRVPLPTYPFERLRFTLPDST